MTALQALETLDYDVLVELSTLNIAEKGEPAISHVRAALERGSHVVTANKGPAAFAYRELDGPGPGKTACAFFLKARSWTAPRSSAWAGPGGCRVTGISGILNTTTNFVISRLEAGESMDQRGKNRPGAGLCRSRSRPGPRGLGRGGQDRHPGQFFMAADISPLKVERRGIADLTPARPPRGLAARDGAGS